jgi:hypothetical protein
MESGVFSLELPVSEKPLSFKVAGFHAAGKTGHFDSLIQN